MGSWPRNDQAGPHSKFHGQLLQYVKNLSTNSRVLSILHSKSHDMVRCGAANRRGGGESRTNGRRGRGRAPTVLLLPSWEANLITAFTELDLLHPANIMSTSNNTLQGNFPCILLRSRYSPLPRNIKINQHYSDIVQCPLNGLRSSISLVKTYPCVGNWLKPTWIAVSLVSVVSAIVLPVAHPRLRDAPGPDNWFKPK